MVSKLEFSREVTVDLKADANFDERWGGPDHVRLPQMCQRSLSRTGLSHNHVPLKKERQRADDGSPGSTCKKAEAPADGRSWGLGGLGPSTWSNANRPLAVPKTKPRPVDQGFVEQPSEGHFGDLTFHQPAIRLSVPVQVCFFGIPCPLR